ncbi:hypothetical protein BN1708_007160 [Verticillium longisporum]|uniref:Velvet domain-containing protein n=1 Tax=Verticillium longisporum TaxID=100787 RepID=A0A0G4MR15_VERLO|nr:hypothetical protein BN1708_007160 [Verticillium longisporum]
MDRPSNPPTQRSHAPTRDDYYSAPAYLNSNSNPNSNRLPSLANLVTGAPTPIHAPSPRDSISSQASSYHVSEYGSPSPVQYQPPPFRSSRNRPGAYPLMSRRAAPPPPPTQFLEAVSPTRESATHERSLQDYAVHSQPSPHATHSFAHDQYQNKAPIPYTSQPLRETPMVRPRPTSPPRPPQAVDVYQPQERGMASQLAGNDVRPALQPPRPVPEPDPTLKDEYKIFIRQQPIAARSCGFGERDRRVIDPPPIVQLEINNPKLSKEDISQRYRHQYYVVHCTIWSKDGTEDCSIMPEEYHRQQRRLMGSLAASSFVGKDENGIEGCFFPFSDLSVRTSGEYRLKFSIVVLNPAQGKMGKSSKIHSSAMTDVFTVYSAKDFPGMKPSTLLTRRLKEQGCLISIKKGNDKAGGGRGHDSSDDEAEEAPPNARHGGYRRFTALAEDSGTDEASI